MPPSPERQRKDPDTFLPDGWKIVDGIVDRIDRTPKMMQSVDKDTEESLRIAFRVPKDDAVDIQVSMRGNNADLIMKSKRNPLRIYCRYLRDLASGDPPTREHSPYTADLPLYQRSSVDAYLKKRMGIAEESYDRIRFDVKRDRIFSEYKCFYYLGGQVTH